MRARLLRGIDRFFATYVWMIAALWAFWMLLDFVLGMVVFAGRTGIWYIWLGGTVGGVLSMIAVAILKAIFHGRVRCALGEVKASPARGAHD